MGGRALMGVVSEQEKAVLDRFASAYPERTPPCVVDVGANVGDYVAEVLARFPTAIVFAFEPQRAAFEKLERRFEGRTVLPLNVGLSDEPGEAELRASAHGECVLATLYDRPDADSYHGSGVALERLERVQLETLDAVLYPHSIDWLKIDVEGHELAVLRGAEKLITGCVDIVQFEFNDCARIAGVALADIHGWLWDLGFTLYFEAEHGPVHVDDPAQYEQAIGDFLAVSGRCGWWG